MYTGLIEAIGQILKAEYGNGLSLKIGLNLKNKDFLSDVKLGDSISVNGVCLTVTEIDLNLNTWSADVSPETLKLTSLGHIQSQSTGPKSYVNLEKSLKINQRLGGHFVQGHVDGLGEIIKIKSNQNSTLIQIKSPQSLMKYISKKGSISIDGVSLTVNNIDDSQNIFELMIIPHTWSETVFQYYKIGDKVNLEIDMIARYLERLIQNQDNQNFNNKKISMDLLKSSGFI